MNVLEQIEEKKKGIAYVEKVLGNTDTQLQPWEVKEYETLLKDYQKELDNIQAYVKANKAVFYPNK